MNELNEEAVTALSLARAMLAEIDAMRPGTTTAVRRRMLAEQKAFQSSQSEYERRAAPLLAEGIDNLGWANLTAPPRQSSLDL